MNSASMKGFNPMTKQKKEPRGAFYFCVEFKVPISDDPKGWGSITASACSPWDDSVFQAHSWGIWIRDDDDTAHWIQWDRITSLTFQENTVLYVPDNPEHERAAKESTVRLAAIQDKALAEFKQRMAEKGEDKKNNAGGRQ